MGFGALKKLRGTVARSYVWQGVDDVYQVFIRPLGLLKSCGRESLQHLLVGLLLVLRNLVLEQVLQSELYEAGAILREKQFVIHVADGSRLQDLQYVLVPSVLWLHHLLLVL